MASSTALSVAASANARIDSHSRRSAKLGSLNQHQSKLSFPRKLNHSQGRQTVSIRAEYNDGSRGGAGDFISGFIVGGAVFGTLAYLFAPQIRRSILNEDEHGFQRPKRPVYYDEDEYGLEKTRKTLSEKISQLSSAIDNVSSRLRKGNKAVPEDADAESNVEAIM